MASLLKYASDSELKNIGTAAAIGLTGGTAATIGKDLVKYNLEGRKLIKNSIDDINKLRHMHTRLPAPATAWNLLEGAKHNRQMLRNLNSAKGLQALAKINAGKAGLAALGIGGGAYLFNKLIG